MAMTQMPGATGAGTKPLAPASNIAPRPPVASTSQASTRLPCWAASWASAAATVVLPTPPLPVTNSNWRPSSAAPGMAVTGGRLVRGPSGRPEPPPALAVGRTDLDVRQDGLPVGSVPQVDLELFGGLGDPDADFQLRLLSRRGHRPDAPAGTTGRGGARRYRPRAHWGHG